MAARDDDSTRIPVSEFLEAHAAKRSGWKDFLHSNLFTALVMWVLGQGLVVGGVVISFYIKVSQLTEWKGSMEARVDSIEKTTTDNKYRIETNANKIAGLESRLHQMEEDTKHFDVMEFEHRRLTEDVERLKNEKR